MDTNETKEKVKGTVDKIFDASKRALGKAGKAVQDFSDKSVIKIEIRQIESKIKAKKTEIGELVYDSIISNNEINTQNEKIQSLIKEITELNKDIEERSVSLTQKSE